MAISKTILVVDDDAEVLGICRTVLEEKGYHVLTSSDGKSCMRDVIVKKPDLIVLDIRMPGMDGLNVLDMIKVSQLGREVPIIVWSGEADRETQQKAEKLGADEFLAKSIAMPEFARRVMSHLFSVDYATLQDIVRHTPAEPPAGASLSGIDPNDYKDWDLRPVTYQEMDLCVFLPKGAAPSAAAAYTAEEAATKVAVFQKLKSRWKRLWPR